MAIAAAQEFDTADVLAPEQPLTIEDSVFDDNHEDEPEGDHVIVDHVELPEVLGVA